MTAIACKGTLKQVSIIDKSVLAHIVVNAGNISRSDDILINNCPALVHAIVTGVLGRSQKEYDDDPTFGPSDLSHCTIKIIIE